MLVSLLFVIGTMIEFAIVLSLKQRQERSSGRTIVGKRKSTNEQFNMSQQVWCVTQVSDNDCEDNNNAANGINQEKKTTIQKIDEASFACFTIAYLIFNISYFIFNSK